MAQAGKPVTLLHIAVKAVVVVVTVKIVEVEVPMASKKRSTGALAGNLKPGSITKGING